MGRNAIVGQSGGPSAVINASLCGVISQCFKENDIDKVYGLRHGIEGLIKGDVVDLSFLDATGTHSEDLELLRYTPSAYLGSCRYKLSKTNETDIKVIFEQLEKYDIGYFFYIGGNDSMDTVATLANYAHAHNYDLKIMGVPKTVDNDLAITDHTPGFASAAKYIATSVREAMLDSNVYDKKMITIVEMMGRHSGWLTASAALALNGENHDNMMIYLPEIVFNIDDFCAEVRERMKKTDKLLIAVSEGIRFENGGFVCEANSKGERDAFGHATLSGCTNVLECALKNVLNVKYRSFELSILQRCAGHLASKVDNDESFLAGKTAVELAIAGETAKMVCFFRETTENGEYKITMKPHDVNQICNVEKLFPLEWIADDRFVSQDFIDYARPLIAGEIKMPMANGLPKYVEIPK